nr:hypothetical protein [Methylomonas lenta]
MDADNQGVIRPKGSTSKVAAKYDGKIRHDGKFSHGYSEANAARAQQIDGSPYVPRTISTSSSEAIATYFATTGNTEDGFIYVIDAEQLTQEGVLDFEFADPEHPHELEVTLVLQLHDFVPPVLIVRKYEVKSDWMQT